MIAKQNPYLVSRRVDILAKIHGNLRAKLEKIRVGLPGSSSRDPVEGPITHSILGNGIFTYTWMVDFYAKFR